MASTKQSTKQPREFLRIVWLPQIIRNPYFYRIRPSIMTVGATRDSLIFRDSVGGTSAVHVLCPLESTMCGSGVHFEVAFRVRPRRWLPTNTSDVEGDLLQLVGFMLESGACHLRCGACHLRCGAHQQTLIWPGIGLLDREQQKQNQARQYGKGSLGERH